MRLSLPISMRRFTRLKGLMTETRGSTIAMIAAGLIPAIAALGASIDAGRMYIVRSQLQAGVDAAALAGARAFAVTDGTTRARDKQAEAYFYGNFPKTPAYMGVTSLTLDPKFDVVNGINVTTVTAEAILPLSFMSIFQFTDPKLTAVAKAELQPRPLEVMMVLDDTGSMRANLSAGRTREIALKEAAKDFMSILHQGATSRRDLAVGFVGYDVTANVGHLLPSNAVAKVEGFNTFLGTGALLTTYASGNNYAWKGCVMADSTVKDVNSDRLVSEANAWDLTRVLPGEGGNPPVQPYFVPPMYVPEVAADSKKTWAELGANDPTKPFYNVSSVEPGNNLYRLDETSLGNIGATYLVQQSIYKEYLYDYYIGLNDGDAKKSDDVVVKSDGSYFDPTVTNARTTVSWKIDWKNLPRYNDKKIWKSPTDAEVNPDGGKVDDIAKDTTPMPSPNWQCPEEAMLLAYGRPATEYTTRIETKHAAIYPANGTIHHAGFLWGYRLLVRDDVFKRVNPTNERPRRALVFMTDGANEIGETQNGWTDRTFSWYGRWSDARISAKASDGETQMLRRFEKTCANLQREPNAPDVYIIALVANTAAINTAFDGCAPGRVYRTDSTAGLKKAFQDVAAELVDLHLIQ